MKNAWLANKPTVFTKSPSSEGLFCALNYAILKLCHTLGMSLSRSQRGNVLFLILIAVALFAALTYAVTQTARTNTADSGREKQDMLAAEILDYAAMIDASIQRLRLSKGCSITDISFFMPGNPDLVGYDHTPSDRPDCRVFSPTAGGVSYQKPPIGANDGSLWLFSGTNQVLAVGSDMQGPFGVDSNDLIAFLPYITPELCSAINSKLGLPTNPPVDTGNWGYIKFIGTYGPDVDGIDDGGGLLSGKATGCFRATGVFGGPTNGGYHFYAVLIPR